MTAKPPRERKMPLSYIQFHQPQDVPGCPHRCKRLVAGEFIPNTMVPCPALFLDPELRLICIGDNLIPLDGGQVDYFKRARMAVSPAVLK